MRKKADTIPDGSGVYWDGRHYDAGNEGAQNDLPFYLGLARRARGPALELACGTGRLTLALLKAGLRATGLDVSAPMLERAREKAAEAGLKAEFVRADARRFSLGRRFGLVFIAFNSLQHFHDRRSLEGLFACVRRHLAPGGRFAFDVFNPHPLHLVRDPDELLPVSVYGDPAGRGKVLVQEQYRYDRAAQVSRILWHYWLDRRKLGARELNMRCFFPQELDALLHYNGFRVLGKYGAFPRRPFLADSPKQIIEAALRR